jgi:VWFA-related protein
MRVLTNRTRVSLATRRRTRFALVASVLPMVLCAAAILWAQSPGPDEIRVSSRPYTPPPQTVLQVKTQLVEVGIVVRDAKGHTVPGLKQSNFQILDNGKPQNISTFSVEKFTAATDTEPAQPSGTPPSATPAVPPATARPPRFVAIYFDDIDTEAGDMDRAKVAASELAKNGVEAGNQIGIFTGSGTVTSEFTSDASKVLEAIGRVTQHPRMPVNGFPGCPKITPYQAYLIVNHLDPTMYQQVVADAVRCACSDVGGTEHSCEQTAQQEVDSKAQTTWDAATQVSQTTLFTLKQIVNYLSQRPGERVLVVASPGYLVGDELDTVQDSVISLALHEGVVINSLDLKGLYAEGPGGGVEGLKEINKDTNMEAPYLIMYDSITRGQRLSFQTASLGELAAGTGGTFFHNRNDLGAGFHRLADAPEVAYLLAFSPENLKPDGKYHKLKVALNGQSYPFVLARPGYFAPTKESEKTVATAAPTPQEKLAKELFASDAPTDVPDEITAESGRDKSGQPILWVGIHIDMKKLQFQKQKDRSVQTLTFLMALLDEKGNFVTGKEGAMNLALKDATLDHLMVAGLNAKLFLEAPPGAYQLRAVTQEAIEGKMTATTSSVEIK